MQPRDNIKMNNWAWQYLRQCEAFAHPTAAGLLIDSAFSFTLLTFFACLFPPVRCFVALSIDALRRFRLLGDGKWPPLSLPLSLSLLLLLLLLCNCRRYFFFGGVPSRSELDPTPTPAELPAVAPAESWLRWYRLLTVFTGKNSSLFSSKSAAVARDELGRTSSGAVSVKFGESSKAAFFDDRWASREWPFVAAFSLASTAASLASAATTFR